MMMMHRTSTPPAGNTGRGSSRSSTSTPASNRGGIQKRRAPPPRVDKDGDLNMDSTNSARGKGSGGRVRGRGRGGSSSQGSGNENSKPNLANVGPQRGIFSGAALQKAIARGMASGEVTIKGPSRAWKMEGLVKDSSGKAKDGYGGLNQIAVVGLKQSKAASNSDGGVKDLLAFLERKATGTDPSTRDQVRIRKSRPEGEAIIISVKAEDTPKIIRLDTFTFAGTQLKITLYEGSSTFREGVNQEPSQAALETRQRLTSALFRRYDASTKLLNLSALGKDPELLQMGTFDKTSTTSKMFLALMTVCDQNFINEQQKREAVISVSLAENELRNISLVTSLAQTFPDLKNLDLSNNKFENMSALSGWRWRFRSLDHLVLTGNPLERVEPNYKDDVLRWYPSLRMLNGVQVRSDEEIAALAAKNIQAAQGKTPLPIRPALFQDESHIAENFIKDFFPLFDTQRGILANKYYDQNSTFSFNINTSAPRAAQASQQPGVSELKPQVWDTYIKRSRNLLKIQHLPARISRNNTGVGEITQSWNALPVTRHPDLFSEGHKWLIECNSLPGLPDSSGQVAAGVGGLVVIAHGQFDEIDVSTGQSIITRSFDRTFILGPGGPTGITVINDMLTLRAYGGSEAWIPDEMETVISPPVDVQSSVPHTIDLGNFSRSAKEKPEEQLQQEIMVVEMSKRTGMTLEYSKMCLDETGYSFDGALAAFANVKGNLPSEAFYPSGFVFV